MAAVGIQVLFHAVMTFFEDTIRKPDMVTAWTALILTNSDILIDTGQVADECKKHPALLYVKNLGTVNERRSNRLEDGQWKNLSLHAGTSDGLLDVQTMS
jgi:hypothetical protein